MSGGGPLTSLSEQQYLNCAGSDACAGGNAWGGWSSLLDTSKGQVSESTLPYTMATTPCDLAVINPGGVAALDPVDNDGYEESGYVLSSEAAVMQYVYTTGSVVVSCVVRRARCSTLTRMLCRCP